MLVYSVSWFNLPLTDTQGQDVNARFSAEEHRFGIHAGGRLRPPERHPIRGGIGARGTGGWVSVR
jgi:hypothetical protein